jgi:hypothetical protein
MASAVHDIGYETPSRMQVKDPHSAVMSDEAYRSNHCSSLIKAPLIETEWAITPARIASTSIGLSRLTSAWNPSAKQRNWYVRGWILRYIQVSAPLAQ